MSGPTVSTLVVSWNSRGFLGRCLESLPVGTEVVVVDNASTDGSADFVAEKFPQAKLIRLDRNIGFAAGVNRAFQDATGDYILLLNPDAESCRQIALRQPILRNAELSKLICVDPR